MAGDDSGGLRVVQRILRTEVRSASVTGSPLMVPGDARSPVGGDEGTEAPEVTSMQQHPILTALDGGEMNTIEGAVLMDALGEFLSRYLPHVAEGDPYRLALVALACASGCPQRALQVRLAAL